MNRIHLVIVIIYITLKLKLTIFNSTCSIFLYFREPRRQSLAVPTLDGVLGVRRHSVPVNTEPTLPRTIYRRESLPSGRGSLPGRSPVSPVPTDSRASSGLHEEHELMKFGSQTSIISSGSPHHSSGNTNS